MDMSASIKSSLFVAVGGLIGAALGIVILLTIAGLGIVNAQTSANMTSAAATLSLFMGVIAIFAAIKLFT